MEGGVLSPGTMLGAPLDSGMDFDNMDELLLEGCWLETTDGSEFLHQNPSSYSTFFDPSFLWPSLESYNGNLNMSPSQKSNQEERQRSLFSDNLPINKPHGRSPANAHSQGQNIFNVAPCSGQSENYTTEGSEESELSRRWWIGPRENPGPATSVMERLIRALGYIKDFTRDKDVLIQLWVPVNRGGRHVLTTRDQPFSLDPNCSRLVSYRNISVNYQFSAQEDSKGVVGLPGRVYLGKVPEWTPDVRFFRSDEYPRVNDAQRCDVRGTLALPVFEQGSRTCLGVIEVVSTNRKIKYGPELESVCRALEAVDLRSSEGLNTRNVMACNKSHQAALLEIQEVLRLACETHRLPLAQTWVPCIQQGKGGSRHSDKNYAHCVSPVDRACYVADPSIQGFHEACSEHHLLKGQGVAGEAFMTNQPCFSADITSFGKTQYPLSHHAKMLGLHAAVAIRLRSIHAGTADFVLEFFLPMDCTDPEQQKKMLSSLSNIMQHICQSLRVVTDKELAEETALPVSEVRLPEDGRCSREEMLNLEYAHSERYNREDSSLTACLTEVQQNSTFVSSIQKEKRRDLLGNKFSEGRPQQQDSNLKGKVDCSEDCNSLGEHSFSSVVLDKTGEKRRTKAEKTITLQVLQQYFAGTLKDAAKSIGVCPTTLKRICRQHGIKRWPSRKIKKVGHSLQKIQLVMESVQGASGAFEIGSFYTNFPDLASPKISGTTLSSTPKLNDHPKPSSMQPEHGVLSLQQAAIQSPSSSCSPSSSSSHSCSSGTQQHPITWNVGGGEDPLIRENTADGSLKRVRSDTELHASSQDSPKLQPMSQSRQPNIDSHLPLPILHGGQVSREGDAPRVKVTFGDEKIRFRMQNNWRFKNLSNEITRRFNIDDASQFHLKYLDDDAEWILLTCDDDLEECIEICQSSQSHTIKLAAFVL